MIRNDIYISHMGKEYRIGKRSTEWINLISYDQEDEQKGFKHFHADPDMYKKSVPISEIREVYSIHTFGIYKDRKFPIYMERDNQYLLGADDFKIAEQLGFETRGQGDYEKWVDKSEVEHVYEIKKPLPDFVR